MNYIALTLSIALGTAAGFTLANILTIYFSERVDDKGKPAKRWKPKGGRLV